LQLRLDGTLTTLGPQGIDLGEGARLVRTGAAGGLEIDFPDETAAYVTPLYWGSQGKWYLNLDIFPYPGV